MGLNNVHMVMSPKFMSLLHLSMGTFNRQAPLKTFNTPYCGLQGSYHLCPPPFPIQLHLLLFSLLCSFNCHCTHLLSIPLPSSFLSEKLCICCSLCLECSVPRSLHGLPLTPVSIILHQRLFLITLSKIILLPVLFCLLSTYHYS